MDLHSKGDLSLILRRLGSCRLLNMMTRTGESLTVTPDSGPPFTVVLSGGNVSLLAILPNPPKVALRIDAPRI